MKKSPPLSGKVFATELRKIANDNSNLDHPMGYSAFLNELSLRLESKNIMSFIDYSEYGLYVSFSVGGIKCNTKDIKIQDVDLMAREVYDWCVTKGIF